jgi:hypothetical protein
MDNPRFHCKLLFEQAISEQALKNLIIAKGIPGQ